MKSKMLAGLQKTSLIDFPGKISCVAFVSGCNFHCPYCHNPDLARGAYPQPITLEEFRLFLWDRRQFLDGVVISGGEPTLSPYLVDLCQSIRDSGLLVKLDTNGSRPDVLSPLLNKGLVDYIAMDIKSTPERYSAFTNDPDIESRIVRSIRLIMDHGSTYEFRTTCARPFIDKSTIDDIGCIIQGASLYVLQTFKKGILLDPEFAAKPDSLIGSSDMATLKRVVSKWVNHCRIR